MVHQGRVNRRSRWAAGGCIDTPPPSRFCWVQEKPDLWIVGKQAIDDDSNQTGTMRRVVSLRWHDCALARLWALPDCVSGVRHEAVALVCFVPSGQMLAGLLGLPQATFAAKVTVADDKKVWHALR